MITIGLVDDHQIFLDGMVSVLSVQKDFTIKFVENNASVALDQLKTTQIDILISDISMPAMNGIEFVKVVRQKYPDIKILILSMFDNLQTIENIDGYLLKETNSEELIQAIRAIVLDGKRYYKTIANDMDAFAFKHSILTPREREIIRLIANEFTTDEIAEQLFLSKGTIESHRKNIFFKLQVKNIAGLIKRAMYLGIVK